jgi:uncharacterized protein GlcG (DUF336 family)
MTLLVRIAALALALVLAGCGSGAGNGGLTLPEPNALTVADIQRVIAQAVNEAKARQKPATIVVIDRVGNVLAAFQMNGAPKMFVFNGARGPILGGLEGVTLPIELASLSKALTAAYFSSNGNAFTTRTAGQVIQQNFNPSEKNTPAGPLFGVQFSQITCSDVSKTAADGTIGTKRSPIGFAADPGGLPLYKNGQVIGAIGVMSSSDYTVVTEIISTTTDEDEMIATAGTNGLAAPDAIRADRITADGRSLRFINPGSLASDPAAAPPFAAINGVEGTLITIPLYGGNPIVAGTVYGDPPSGIRPDTTPAFAGTGAWILVDNANNNRYPPIAGSDGLLTAAEVTQILKSAIEVANRTRAQVRQPPGSVAQVSMVVVDTNGEILGFIRQPDALVDAIDVIVQKARTAVFFSNPNAAAELSALPPAMYLPPSGAQSPITTYVNNARAFFNNPNIFADGTAFSTRSIGEIAEPFFPEGIEANPAGPLSKPSNEWSIFNNGLELDLVYNRLVAPLLKPNDPTQLAKGCTGNKRIRNGITLFGGGFPIYRGNQLVGAIGASGDGTDQSDLIAFLGLANAGKALNTGVGNAPPAIRADQLVPQGQGTRLRYVNCPPAPFNNSTDQNVCAGL